MKNEASAIGFRTLIAARDGDNLPAESLQRGRDFGAGLRDAAMKVLSVNVGERTTIEYQGKLVETGFFKFPVSRSVLARREGLDGDVQVDRRVHGGPHKAIHAFPSEHYSFYRDLFGSVEWTYGHFGENLTTKGLLERDVRIGDRFRIGEALVEVSQPRSPCFRFGVRLGSRDAVRTCIDSSRTGLYFRVIVEGALKTGDTINAVGSDKDAMTVEEVHRLYYHDKTNREALCRAVACETLSPAFRDDFVARLEQLGAE